MDTNPQDNSELINKIGKFESAGMAETKKWFSIWSEGMRYFFSQHDFPNRKHQDWDYITLNYIWPTAIQEIAKLTKNFPKIIALPWKDEDVEAAEVWQGGAQWQWQGPLNMRMNHPAAILIGKIFGYRVGKVYWEDKAEWDDQQKKWIGDVQYKLWHPGLFWADGVEDINDGNCGTVRVVELEWAKKRWPAFATQLEEVSITSKEVNLFTSGGIGSIQTSRPAGFHSSVSGGDLVESDSGEEIAEINSARQLLDLMIDTKPTESTDTKYVKISETYLKNYDEIQQSQPIPAEQLLRTGQAQQEPMGMLLDPNGQQFTPETYPQNQWVEPAFPNGQFLMSAGEGEKRVLLNSDPQEQKWRFKKWPFVTVPHYLLPFMWQGLNAVSLYKPAQDMINVSVSHLINNLKQFGDPRISIEDGAVATNPKNKRPFSLSSAPGAILHWVKGAISQSKFRIEPPVPMSPAVMATYELFAQEFKNLTGLQAIARGEQKKNMTATEAQALALSSNDRISLQSMYEDEWVRQIGTKIAELMQTYYDPGRWMRVVGQDKIIGIQQITQQMKSVRFDIDVEPGANLPFDEEKRVQKYKMAYDLFAQPMANPMMPDMLRALEIPNWKKLLNDFPAYQQYIGIVKLYEAVTSGQVAPEQAAQMIINEAQNVYAQSAQGKQEQAGAQTGMTQEGQNGRTN